MGINKFNAEGYYDTPAHEALSNITREEGLGKNSVPE